MTAKVVESLSDGIANLLVIEFTARFLVKALVVLILAEVGL